MKNMDQIQNKENNQKKNKKRKNNNKKALSLKIVNKLWKCKKYNK